MKLLLEEAQRVIRLSSVSTEGNEELVNYLQTLLVEKGIRPVLQQVSHSIDGVSKRQFNILGTLGDPLVDRKTRKGLLFLNHLDTVDPGRRENWVKTGGDPFSMQVSDGFAYGLGASSGKIDFLCRLQAIEKYREKKLRMPIYLAGTCGGEMGMFGAKYLLKSLAVNPKVVLVGEPTDLRVVNAHKHLSVFRVNIAFQLVERDAKGFNRRVALECFGRSAHAASPDSGANALYRMLDFLRQVSEAGFELRFTKIEGGGARNKVPDHARSEFYLTSHQYEDFKRFFRETTGEGGQNGSFRADLGGLGETGIRFLPESLHPCLGEFVALFRERANEFLAEKDTRFLPPHSTLNFGFVRQNVGSLDLGFEVRLLPGRSSEELEKSILGKIQGIAAKYPHFNITAIRERLNPAFQNTAEDEFPKDAQAALEMTKLPLEFACSSSSSEAALFSQASFPSLIFGPGSALGASHCPDESVELAQLEKAVEFYRRLIERVCL